MNKDDIIKIEISDNEAFGGQIVHAHLAWDKSKFGTGATSDFDDIEDAKLTAIGDLWQEYGDEIIAHIQSAPAEDLRRVCYSTIAVGETKEVILIGQMEGDTIPEVHSR